MFIIAKKSYLTAIVFILCLMTTLPAFSANKHEPLLLDFEARLSGEVFTFHMQADGSQYLFENWVKGDVSFISGKSLKDQSFRYNGYLDELIWLHPSFYKPVKADKYQIESFTLYPPGGDTLIFENISFKPRFESDSLHFFAQKLYTGDISLVAYRQIKRTGETLESIGPRLVARPKIEPEPVYYLILPDDQVHEVRRLNRRSLYRIFSDERRAIREGFRRECLRINNERDLIKAVGIIDEILEKI